MPLRLVYHVKSTVPVEAEGLLPSSLRNKSRKEVEKTLVWHGNRQVPLAELFQISGDQSDMEIRFEGDLGGVHWIGARLDGGKIHVAGNAGRHVGSQMSAGEIEISGHVDDFLGVEMRAGTIHVHGNAGNQVGGVYPGSRRGMRGGNILVEGNVGHELGRSMRRGLIAVGGSTGEGPGYGMIAGTILIAGECGPRPAVNMRRGTMVLTDPRQRPALLPSFRQACRRSPEFLPLVLAELERLGFQMSSSGKATDLISEYDVYNGDLLTIGKGEILMRCKM